KEKEHSPSLVFRNAATNLGNAAAPLLGQGGVAAPSTKWPRSFERRGRGGLFKRLAVHLRFGQAPATTFDGSSLIRPQALRRPGDSRTGQPLCRTVRNNWSVRLHIHRR